MTTADEIIDDVTEGAAPVSALLEYLDDSDAQRRRAASLALSTVAEADPEHLEDVDTALVSLLDSEDPTVQMQVAAALAAYVHADPERGPQIAANAADCLANESPLVRKHALSILRDAARVDPTVVEPAVEDVVDLLDADTAAVRQRAVAVLLLVCQESPDRLTGTEKALVARLDDRVDDPTTFEGYEPPTAMRGGKTEQDPLQRIYSDERIRSDAIREGVAVLVATLAETDPSGFERLVPQLREHVDDDRRAVRRSVIETLGLLAEADLVDPDAIAPALLDRLDDHSDIVRGRAAWALAVLADRSEPVRQRAARRIESNLDLLEANDQEIRVGVTTLAAVIVDARPEVLRPARETFERLRAEGSETVSQQAAFVLDALDT